MFTGIVEELGSIASRDGDRLRINASLVLDDVQLGASIAVNGCCLTVVDWGSDDGDVACEKPTWWSADVVDESLARTVARRAAQPATPSTSSGRCGCRTGSAGISCRATSTGSARSSNPAPDLRVRVRDRDLMRYVVEKGSITVDGVSLTVVDVLDDGFTVAVIPHTAEVTTLGHKGVGDLVNLEVDVTAKYVERLLAWKEQS